jgi:hypothetical protein
MKDIQKVWPEYRCTYPFTRSFRAVFSLLMCRMWLTFGPIAVFGVRRLAAAFQYGRNLFDPQRTFDVVRSFARFEKRKQAFAPQSTTPRAAKT